MVPPLFLPFANVIWPAFSSPYVVPILVPIAPLILPLVLVSFGLEVCLIAASWRDVIPRRRLIRWVIEANCGSWIAGFLITTLLASSILPTGWGTMETGTTGVSIATLGPNFRNLALLSFLPCLFLSVVIEGLVYQLLRRQIALPRFWSTVLRANVASYLPLLPAVWLVT